MGRKKDTKIERQATATEALNKDADRLFDEFGDGESLFERDIIVRVDKELAPTSKKNREQNV
jgi:hypothetical protein